MTPRLARQGLPWLAVVAAAYLVTRTWHLTALPMFFDEAFHILWGDRWHGPHGLSRALWGGKLLGVAAIGAATSLGPDDPLRAARLAVVLIGLVTLFSSFWLGRRIGGLPGGVITAVLVVACPFLLFHDRMALVDPFVTAFAALALVATVGLCDHPSPGRGALLGLALAAAGAAKVLGVVAFVPSLVGVVLLAGRDGRAWRALGVAWGVAGVLLWVPVRGFVGGGGEVGEKAALFAEDRWALARENLVQLGAWLWVYQTPTILALGLLATFLALARRRRLEILLVFAWAFPLVAFVLGVRVWYPRYILFTAVPLLALVGGALGEAWSRALSTAGRVSVLVLLVGSLVPGALFLQALLEDPSSVRLPQVDRWQYVEGWPSGYGWAEAHAFLLGEMAGEPVPHRVATEPYHWTLKASFLGQRGVAVKAFDVWSPSELVRAADWTGRGGGWLVVSKPVVADGPLELTHLAGFTKPGRRGSVHVYRLRPSHRDPRSRPPRVGDEAAGDP